MVGLKKGGGGDLIVQWLLLRGVFCGSAKSDFRKPEVLWMFSLFSVNNKKGSGDDSFTLELWRLNNPTSCSSKITWEISFFFGRGRGLAR